jgi:hypothetical protein
MFYWGTGCAGWGMTQTTGASCGNLLASRWGTIRDNGTGDELSEGPKNPESSFLFRGSYQPLTSNPLCASWYRELLLNIPSQAVLSRKVMVHP